ncbi:protease HtpX [Luteimonas aestuarii]|uniref:Protease HtpX n=1 Tax=Luteimonas aestuarii TaxID=453837 RepID=A0A4R5TV41_9GAMM|nr:protease HtpX [Luteimonas aestuarii]TDK24947.1 protease HtpX [Luteimonas aestuarii]
MFKRITLFLITNLAVLVLLGIIMNVVLPMFGIRLAGMGGLLVFAAIFGFGGAFISLLMSKWSAKRFSGAQVITEPRNDTERWLVDTVRRQADAAGIGMPEVAIFDAPEINAFATGANRNNALVAVSTGLLRAMDKDEAEAVLGHEVAHVANGDMVTMALLQGVLNTFVIVLARLVARALSNYMGRDLGGLAYFAVVFVLDMIFGLFASMIAMWFSRHREFRADAGGAALAGRDKMVKALEKLSLTYGHNTLPKQVAAFGISGGVGHGLKKLLMSHPPLEERIQALRNVPQDQLRQNLAA